MKETYENIEYLDAAIISKFYHGEVCEKRSNFEKSLFRRVYKRAYMIVQKQVELQLPRGQEEGVKETNDNVIIFMGRRGTGKSSVMRSFMQSLLDNSKLADETEDYVVRLEGSTKRVRFIGIDSIDASLLEQKEDIFEAILAKMFNEFLKDNENTNSESLTYEKRELYQMFSSIYKKHLNIKQRDFGDIYSSEAAISNLRDLARSVDIKQEFESLIEKYIQVKSYCEYGYSERDRYETFLVVSIDDIDMNVNSGFEILEKIQRYLKVKHLIVLLAVNHEQMKLCCQKHFQSIISNNRGSNIEDLNRYIDKLADQYMEKALPSYSRVYLPSLKKMDYDKNHAIMIRDSKKLENIYSIKQDLFLEAWKKTKVRYDTEGKKRHFLEPESLRELNNWKIYRTYMPELEGETSKKFLELLDFNHRRAMDDLLFRYADEVLENKESKIFISLSELHIARRGREIVSEFLHNYDSYDLLDQEETMYISDCIKFGYSYGELLYTLYWMGATYIYDKKLVDAILAMYSLTLTKIFYRYKCECDFNNLEKIKELNTNRNYKILKEIMAESVGGSWSKNIVPNLEKNIMIGEGETEREQRMYYVVGCAKDVLKKRKGRVRFELKEDTQSMIDNLKEVAQSMIDNSKIEDDKIMYDYQYGIVGLIKEMQWEFLLTLFLSNGEWRFEGKDKNEKDKNEKNVNFVTDTEQEHFDKNENKDTTKSSQKRETFLRDTIEEKNYLYLIGKLDYNIMNFINNIFEFDEKLRYFIEQLLILTKGNDKEKDKNEKKVAEIIDILLEEDGFFPNMYSWRKISAGMVVPIYSIDIYYNMFKRIVRDQQLNMDRIQEEDLFDILISLFDKIENALRKNDKAYGEFTKLKNEEKFAYIFNSCPVIKEIRESNEEQRERYGVFVKGMIVSETNRIKSPREEMLDWM